MPITQKGQFISVATPLGEDFFLLRTFTGQEGISQLFNFNLSLLSDRPPVRLESIIGQSVTVTMELANGGKRYFNGAVGRFAQTGQENAITFYQAEVVPWFWFLTRTSDCRIFQNKTVPEIVTQIFQDFGFRNFRTALQSTYEAREAVVQYRETDFNFVSRLLESEGIFYFFEHEQGRHTLVLADRPVAHPVLPGTASLAYQPTGATPAAVTRLMLTREWRPGKYAADDYNFITPSTSLAVTAASAADIGGNRAYEVYEYPGDYQRKTQGNALAKTRLQEIESTSQLVNGSSTCRTMAAGYRFALAGHSREDLNQAYVVTTVRHEAAVGNSPGSDTYSNEFTAIPFAVPFRPLRLAETPLVWGPEIGVVVGPSAQEIFVDEYGRVKVQFHWDREGKSDENSSGWIRVAQPWAGSQWGTLFIPRIGQEVIVEFLHGDLSRPFIVGSLYNGDERPPYTLPANQTITTIKSNSSKGGGGANELRFEDKKGAEEVFLHAQRDWRTIIEHDQDETVGNNKTAKIDNNRNEAVGKAQTLTVGTTYQVTVGTAMNETIGGSMTVTVAKKSTEAIGLDKQLDVGNTLAETVGKNLTLSVGTDANLTIARNCNVSSGSGIAMEAANT